LYKEYHSSSDFTKMDNFPQSLFIASINRALLSHSAARYFSLNKKRASFWRMKKKTCLASTTALKQLTAERANVRVRK
jgi:hypothetical protein